MLLFYYHYLLVCYFLTIWIQQPSYVIVIFTIFQSIYGVITDLPVDELFGWQALVSLAGIVAGMVFVYIVRPPFLLVWKDKYVEVWFKFLISTALFVGATIPYAVWPIPTEPWGVLVSSLLTPIAIAITWLTLNWVEHLWESKKASVRLNFFFIFWMFTTSAMSFSFYLVYAIIERWASFAAAMIAIIVILMATIFCPHQANLTITDGDILIHS